MPLPMDRFAPIPTQNYSIATRLCERTTVGIHAELNGNFQHHTMGFLLSLGGEFFLITCRHTIVNILDTGVELWIGRNSAGKALRLTGTFHYPKSPSNDAAIIRLPPGAADFFGTERFAKFDDLCHSKQPIGIPCVMHGALRDLSRKWDMSITSDDNRLMTVTYFGRTTTTPVSIGQLDDKMQFLICADNLVTTIGNENRMVRSELNASFEGLSGTPIYAVDGDPFLPDWNPVDTKIIGIQSTFIGLESAFGNYDFMKVTRIESACSVISEAYPDVWNRRR